MNRKITVGKAAFICLGVYFALFLTYYIPSYVIYGSPDWFIYVRHFLSEFVEYILPTLTALTFIHMTAGRICAKSALYALLLSLPKLIYVIPFQYLNYLAQGFDSIESVSIGAIIGVISVALNTLHVMLFAFIIRITFMRRATAELKLELPPLKRDSTPNSSFAAEAEEMLKASGVRGSIYGMNDNLAVAIFAALAVEFLMCVGMEIYDTAVYLTENTGTYKMNEVAFITLSFVMIMLQLLASQAVCCKYASQPEKE